MPRKTATKIFPISRHLALVVVILSTFLFFLTKPGSFSTQTPDLPAAAGIFKAPPFSCKSKELKGKIYSAKLPQKRISLEGTFPFSHLTFQSQVIAWQGSGAAYFFISQQPNISLYTARSSGVSFISRIFPFTIQPNAP